MSSGACRALVAVLLTLVATIVSAVPVVAQDNQSVDTSSTSTYTVHPDKGTIDVRISVVLTPTQDWRKQAWKQLIVEERSTPQTKEPYRVARRIQPLSGLYRAVNIQTPAIDGGTRSTFPVRYTLRASTDLDAEVRRQIPARLNSSYMYFCVTGQDTNRGTVKVVIDDTERWKPTQLGTFMEPTNNGFRSTEEDKQDLGNVFTCFEAVRQAGLQKDTLVGPDDRAVELQAWAGDESWGPASLDIVPGDLKALRDFLGYDMPGEGTVIIRQTPSRDIGGYASAHGTPGIVQLDEGPAGDTVHQLAHAWFGTDNFREFWLREGMAEWTSSTMSGRTCAPINGNPLELDLSDEGWLVVRPQEPEGVEQLITAQEAAACGIVSAVAARMSEQQWHEVIGSMLLGETKYIGSAGPEIGTATFVNWRTWLDAVDERGLVPAAANPQYAGNVDDLDFAQDLLAQFEIPATDSELEDRSVARAAYHEFLDYVAPLGAPRAVRKDMEDWEFGTAMARMEKSREVFDRLTEADDNLPEADLLRIMKPQFEAAKDEAELDEVAVLVQTILEQTTTLVGPLGALQDVLEPMGWSQPVAIIDAIGSRRFDDAKSAIAPAIEAARAVSEAHAALPEAGFLDRYRPLYEIATTKTRLEEILRDAESDARNARLARDKLDQLQASVGDWTIPLAVTAPLGGGQLQAARGVMDDALAVVRAATAADEALPQAGLRDDVRPKFEAVQTGAQMALLREQVERRADDARTVGDALSTLNLRAPGWIIPAVVADPVAAGDFAGAVEAARASKSWIESAYEADQLLPQIDAIDRTQPLFESAQSLEDLQAGAKLAGEWANAAGIVSLAIEENEKPRGMLTSIGLWGQNVTPVVEEALQLAIEGKVADAIQKANEAILTLQGGEAAGSLRLAGIIFFGVAVLGVLGLWVMLRRQAGPSWARSTKPHWVDKEEKGGFFGRRKKKDTKGKKGKKGKP